MAMDDIEQLGIFDWLMIIMLCAIITFIIFGAVNAVLGIIYKERLLNTACSLCAQEHPELMCIYPSKFPVNITI